MSFATASQAIDLAASSGQPFVLQLSGGEPLLAFDLIEEIVAYVEQNKLPATMQIQTNASLIDRRIAIFLRDHQIGIGISLDGRPTQNDALRKLPGGCGTSRLTLAGAATLASVGVETGITCVVADSNVRHLRGIVEMPTIWAMFAKSALICCGLRGVERPLRRLPPLICRWPFRKS